MLGLYWDNGKENGNYYNGVIEGLKAVTDWNQQTLAAPNRSMESALVAAPSTVDLETWAGLEIWLL